MPRNGASRPETVSAAESCVRETPCDLCGGLEFELVAQRDRRGRALSTVLCKRCGLVSHLAIPSDQELLRYYQRHYRQEYHGQGRPAPHRIVRAWRRGEELTRLLGGGLNPGDGVLDVGAGLGCTIKQLELAGLAARGIEPGVEFQDFSRRELAAQIGIGTWQDLPSQPRYRLVLMVHVIEHLSSPRAALAHLRTTLAPGGQLYVECPNLYSPHAAPGRWFHPAHVYNFTPATLAMLCRGCGFQIDATLGDERDRNLRLLLSRAPANHALNTDGYQQAREALTRYNTLTYHLRWSYLRERCCGLLRDLSDHWRAASRVEKIVAQCQRGRAASGIGEPSRRAA